MSERFFNDLKSFTDFSKVTEGTRYKPVPDDWFIIIADVRGSTEAIKKGRYKQVNMVGAACIAAAHNVSNGIGIPFVFGGDGATILCPPVLLDAIRNELLRTQNLSKETLHIDLRVGAIAVKELRKQGKDVLVAKYELSPKNYLAMMRGGGIEFADTLIKKNPSYQWHSDDSAQPNIAGLTCRWENIRARNGKMLTLLVKAVSGNAEERDAIYSEVNRFIRKQASKPVSQKNLRYTWPPKTLQLETKMHNGNSTMLLGLYAFTFLFAFLMKTGIRLGKFNSRKYKQELETNSDFQKFDDMLRMVVDTDEASIHTIEEYLAALHQKKKIVYGTNISETAQMTCFVPSWQEGEHIHFIDGADGGYAFAAIHLKKQLQELTL